MHDGAMPRAYPKGDTVAMTAPAGNTDGNTTDTTEGTPGATPDESALGDGGKAALAAERKRANEAEKAHRALAAELQAIKDKDADATEVAARKATEAEARAAAAESELLRLKVSVEKGLSAELAARLHGSTEDELRADADALLKLIPAKPAADPAPKPAGKPREALKGGGDPTGGAMPLNGDPIEAALRAKLGIA